MIETIREGIGWLFPHVGIQVMPITSPMIETMEEVKGGAVPRYRIQSAR